MNHGTTVYGDIFEVLPVASNALRAEYLPPCPVQSTDEQYVNRSGGVNAEDSHYINNFSHVFERGYASPTLTVLNIHFEIIVMHLSYQ